MLVAFIFTAFIDRKCVTTSIIIVRKSKGTLVVIVILASSFILVLLFWLACEDVLGDCTGGMECSISPANYFVVKE